MKLFKDEQILVNSNDNKIILTDQRVHMVEKRWGGSYSNTIFLEDISSVEIRYKSNLLYLLLGTLFGLLFFINMNNGDIRTGDATISGLPLLIGVGLIISYFFSRKYIISISPNGGKSLDFEIKQMSEKQVQGFIDNVQEAKANRTKQLHNIEKIN